MSEGSNQNNRMTWTTPQVRRIEAGSAENTNKGATPDGGTSPSGTNFS
jgi:hypothetical protein